ncbi:LysR family transcriptional regulator [Shewanella gelidii]|uniref:Transcriptional regulator n=1 Tax=Shewanella gelidii TaxID=1642821 RepID=A0A917NDG4_9GAMM|nr:LysR family transcriptional regulator [Shewanella gelidii]MCL1099382.1 LysR family transcriptional regulator [Shewanella gelidii]GGI91363.1 transcriptional regulator [Shewanella gelidii]
MSTISTSKAIQQLDLNLLKVFESLYRERNMTQTAKVLFITPSAVSHAMKRLREALGDPLFVRQGQLMQPTPACDRMAPQLLDGLIRIRQILQQCGAFDLATTEQTFSLSIHDALEAMTIPSIIKDVNQYAPNAKLASIKLDRDNMSRQLASGQIDVAIDVAMPLKSPIHHYKLSSDPFCVLMNANHKLASSLDQKSYIAAEHIAVSLRASGRVVEDLALQQQGVNRKIGVRCQNYQTAKDILKHSSALLTLPKLIAQQLVDRELVITHLPFQISDVETRLYWHKNTEEDEAMIWLRKLLIRKFDALKQ